MGKMVKTALPIAAMVGLGFATGGFGLAGAGAAGAAGAAAPGAALAGTFGGIGTYGGGGGFLSSLFSAKGASTIFSGLSAASSLIGGISNARDEQLAAAMETRRIETLELQALQEEANIKDEARRNRNSAIAQAVAGNRDPFSDRSFMAFVDDQKNRETRTITNIKAEAASGITTSRMNIARRGDRATTSLVTGAMKGARTLFGSYERWDA